MTFEQAWSELARHLRLLFAEVFVLIPVKRVRAYGLRLRGIPND